MFLSSPFELFFIILLLLSCLFSNSRTNSQNRTNDIAEDYIVSSTP
ncbi:hypothetical protein Vi05172_g8805 [Venturia inaequalis]|nr:hypothetical protein Vi05172_g8805 [Venturia inaequalis]